MKHFYLLILFISIASKAFCQDFISIFEFERTFNIKKDSLSGTCFLILRDQLNYWVTAKHVLGKVQNNQKISFYILRDSTWYPLGGTVLLHSNPSIDIAIIVPDDTTTNFAIKLDEVDMTLGDEGFFLGYPFGFKSTDKGNINKGFPIALVKKCTFSGKYSENGIQMLFLDGNNNPGFSGGPVFFKNRLNPKDQKLYLAGVVSAYVNQWNQMVTPIGTYNYSENSGIILAYATKHIKEILIQNGR